VESAFNAFLAPYVQKLRESGTDWAKYPADAPPSQVAVLLCQLSRELWEVEKDPCLPYTMESIVSYLLQAATENLIETLSDIALTRAKLIRLLKKRRDQISHL
jgi:hypothetical protein